MARSEQENRAITEKIAYLVNVEGLRPDRATAAAFRMFKEGELDIPKPEPKIPTVEEVEDEFKNETRKRLRKRKQKENEVRKQFLAALKSLL